MKPGRELDLLIAEKVIGLKRSKGRREYFGTILLDWWEFSDGRISSAPHCYSTDISAAWEVVDKANITEIRRIEPGKWVARSYDDNYGGGVVLREYGVGDTAPHAICLAALKAIEFGENGKTEAGR